MNFIYNLLNVALGSPEWKENVLNSLDIMWKGVLAIFLVIAVVIIAVLLLNRLTNKKPKNNDGAEDNE